MLSFQAKILTRNKERNYCAPGLYSMATVPHTLLWWSMTTCTSKTFPSLIFFPFTNSTLLTCCCEFVPSWTSWSSEHRADVLPGLQVDSPDSISSATGESRMQWEGFYTKTEFEASTSATVIFPLRKGFIRLQAGKQSLALFCSVGDCDPEIPIEEDFQSHFWNSFISLNFYACLCLLLFQCRITPPSHSNLLVMIESLWQED